MLLLITACGLAITLALTARRTRVAPGRAGRRRLHGPGAGRGDVRGGAARAQRRVPVPAVVSRLRRSGVRGPGLDPDLRRAAGRGCDRGAAKLLPAPPGRLDDERAWQGIAAGVVSGGVGALFVTVFGTGTTVLFVNSAWVRGLLLHGQHLTASAIYGRELFASQNAGALRRPPRGFPIIGLAMALTGAGIRQRNRALPTATVRRVRRVRDRAGAGSARWRTAAPTWSVPLRRSEARPWPALWATAGRRQHCRCDSRSANSSADGVAKCPAAGLRR